QAVPRPDEAGAALVRAGDRHVRRGLVPGAPRRGGAGAAGLVSGDPHELRRGVVPGLLRRAARLGGPRPPRRPEAAGGRLDGPDGPDRSLRHHGAGGLMGTRKRYGESANPKFTRTANPPVFVGKARPKYVDTELNVYDAALGRIRWLFEEFDGKVSVSCSGGKDSTVVVELAAMVAKERGDLPLDVWWLDQETEFQATVDYMRYLMYERDDINLRWYQIPWRLENATDLK